MNTKTLANRAIIQVCETCRDKGADGVEIADAGAILAAATILAAQDSDDVLVQRVRCLGNCSRGLSAVIRCDAAWAYVFGSLQAETDGPALVQGAQLLAASSDGLMPWKERPECLKRGLVARIPPAAFSDASQ